MHITDASNACRTLFYNLHKQDWCDELCEFFDMPREALPRIVSNSEVYGHFKKGHVLEGIPIAGLIGDQQAALVGNKCLTKGDAKQTYGESARARAFVSVPYVGSGNPGPSLCSESLTHATIYPCRYRMLHAFQHGDRHCQVHARPRHHRTFPRFQAVAVL